MTSTTTTQHDRGSTSDRRAAWTVARALHESTTLTKTVTVGATGIVLAAALVSDIPLATSITIVALLPAVLVDVLVRRLPNRLIGAAAFVGLVASALSIAAGTDIAPIDGLLGALAMAVPLFVIHLVSPASMGFGDVKLAFVLGASLGVTDPSMPLVALAVGSLCAAVHGLATRQRSIAFGPGLLAGAVLVVAVLSLGSPTDSDTPAPASAPTRTQT